MSSPRQIVWTIIGMIAMSSFSFAFANASVLDKESPAPIVLNGSTVELTDDTKDVDIAINVDDLEEDALFENATQSVSTQGADDVDIDGIPERGISVIIQNETIYVTRAPVIIDLTDEVGPSIVDEIDDLN